MPVNVVREVDDWVEVQRVLVSVADKSGLDTLIPQLIDACEGIHFYSTGGTHATIRDILPSELRDARLTQVSDYTGQPETQGGLVKTLDFKIYLGLLTETYNASHQADLARTSAVPLDMVIGNLYPFQSTVARQGVTVEEARSNIDIGGPCMIRAAAKNYLRVASVVDPEDYPSLIACLRDHNGQLSLAKRFELARKAFAHTAQYDQAISAFLSEQEAEKVPSAYTLQDL